MGRWHGTTTKRTYHDGNALLYAIVTSRDRVVNSLIILNILDQTRLVYPSIQPTNDGIAKLVAFALGVTTPSFGVSVRQAWGGVSAAVAALGSIIQSATHEPLQTGSRKVLDR
jgi:hypothetical protein